LALNPNITGLLSILAETAAQRVAKNFSDLRCNCFTKRSLDFSDFSDFNDFFFRLAETASRVLLRCMLTFAGICFFLFFLLFFKHVG